MTTAQTDIGALDSSSVVGSVLRQDAGPPPAPVLLESHPADLGLDPIPVDRYLSQEFHDREVEGLWKHVWQMACRADDIPDVGDYVVYEIAEIRLVIVRSGRDEIHALYNSCLHRGSQLIADECGNRAGFQCPYHGWCYGLDGSLLSLPGAWDFPQVQPGQLHIPRARVGVWDGWVFVCLDPSAPELAEHLGVLPEHFAAWPMASRHKTVHVAKVIRCNWKVALEGFVETYHVSAVHPQIRDMTASIESQYDILGPTVSRFVNCAATAGETNPGISEQELADAWCEATSMTPIEVEDGVSARDALAARIRQDFGAATGADLSGISAADLLDGIEYSLFPNFFPWGGVQFVLVYRFRPFANDPRQCVMDIMLLTPGIGDPPATPIHWVGPDETLTDAAPELGPLFQYVLDQDFEQLRQVQLGLQTTPRHGLLASRYQESRLRHFHSTLNEYIQRG